MSPSYGKDCCFQLTVWDKIYAFQTQGWWGELSRCSMGFQAMQKMKQEKASTSKLLGRKGRRIQSWQGQVARKGQASAPQQGHMRLL